MAATVPVIASDKCLMQILPKAPRRGQIGREPARWAI